MGLGIKKAFKGFKKVFKKIGKGIKKAFNKIGQWTGKLGILGQIGLSLILPGIGAAFTGMLTGSSSALLRAAGNFLAKAGEIGKAVGNSFSTVTEGVTKVVGQTIGTVADKLGFQSVGGFKIQNPGFDKVWDTVKETGSQLAEQGKDLFTNTTREMAVTQGLTESVSSQLTDTIDTRVAQDVSSQVGDTFNTQNLTDSVSSQLTDTIDTRVGQDVSSQVGDTFNTQNLADRSIKTTVFPTRHPFENLDGSRSVSNVRLATFGFGEGTRVIPTMVDGELLSKEAALQRAKLEGLENYPLFESLTEAESWIKKNHGRINANGELVESLRSQLTDTIDTSVAQDVSSKASLLAPSSKKSMGIFDKVNQSIVTGIQSGLQQKAFEAAGGKLPETNYTSYSTYIAPDMTMPIQTAEADNLYTSLATDPSMLSQVPWGFNAGVYGEFNAFKNNTSNTQRRSR